MVSNHAVAGIAMTLGMTRCFFAWGLVFDKGSRFKSGSYYQVHWVKVDAFPKAA